MPHRRAEANVGLPVVWRDACDKRGNRLVEGQLHVVRFVAQSVTERARRFRRFSRSVSHQTPPYIHFIRDTQNHLLHRELVAPVRQEVIRHDSYQQ